MTPAERAPVAPVAGSWQHEFAQQPLRKKLTLLPNLSAAALGVTLVITVTFGIINMQWLDTIQHRHYPVMLAARSLQETLSSLQRELEDAAAATDTSRLRVADSLSRAFVREVEGIEAVGNIGSGEAGHVALAFASYYALARTTTATMARSAATESLLPAVREMQRQYLMLNEELRT